jgi:hypothetical protein
MKSHQRQKRRFDEGLDLDSKVTLDSREQAEKHSTSRDATAAGI